MGGVWAGNAWYLRGPAYRAERLRRVRVGVAWVSRAGNAWYLWGGRPTGDERSRGVRVVFAGYIWAVCGRGLRGTGGVGRAFAEGSWGSRGRRWTGGECVVFAGI